MCSALLCDCLSVRDELPTFKTMYTLPSSLWNQTPISKNMSDSLSAVLSLIFSLGSDVVN